MEDYYVILTKSNGTDDKNSKGGADDNASDDKQSQADSASSGGGAPSDKSKNDDKSVTAKALAKSKNGPCDNDKESGIEAEADDLDVDKISTSNRNFAVKTTMEDAKKNLQYGSNSLSKVFASILMNSIQPPKVISHYVLRSITASLYSSAQYKATCHSYPRT